MFNVCIKYMDKVLDYYKTCKVDENHKFITFEFKYMFNV